MNQDAPSSQAEGRRTSAPRRAWTLANRRDLPALAPGLYLVATPIGNLGDVTLRALDVLAGADLIACEDTRITRRLIDHYGIATPLTPYHEHNAAQARPRLLARLADGGVVALVSDAGTPLISDPGYKLVRAAQEGGYAVFPVPGASAVLAALTKSGLPTDRFFFAGFLPPRQNARQQRIADIARVSATLILFETGPRLAASLADLASGLGNRAAVVCRELTKLHEEARAGDLTDLARGYAEAEPPRGEIVIVIAPPDPDRDDARDIDALLRAALGRISLREAVAEVAAATGEPRRAVYQRALALAQESQGESEEDSDDGAER